MDNKNTNTHCLLFDSDGTLVDSELLNCEAMSAELACSGIVEAADDLLHRYRGFMFSAVLDELQRRHNISLDAEFNQRFRQRAAEIFERRLEPIANIDKALQQLQNPMCVVSNGPESKLELALRVTRLNHHFEQVFSAYTVGSWKPDPGLFQHAARVMAFDAEHCIVIEDSRVGVEAASAAGMKSILYLPEPMDLGSIRPTRVIDSMKHLPEAVYEVQREVDPG
jgi:HAD superfamily hydrolase (TIGR01509 family)